MVYGLRFVVANSVWRHVGCGRNQNHKLFQILGTARNSGYFFLCLLQSACWKKPCIAFGWISFGELMAARFTCFCVTWLKYKYQNLAQIQTQNLAQIQIQKLGSNTKEYRYWIWDTVNSGEKPLTCSHASINCVTWLKYKEILLAQIQIQKHTNTVDGKKPLWHTSHGSRQLCQLRLLNIVFSSNIVFLSKWICETVPQWLQVW